MDDRKNTKVQNEARSYRSTKRCFDIVKVLSFQRYPKTAKEIKELLEGIGVDVSSRTVARDCSALQNMGVLLCSVDYSPLNGSAILVYMVNSEWPGNRRMIPSEALAIH